MSGLCRVGFNIKVFFSAKGDGSAGALPEPRRSRLRAGGRVFANTETDLKVREPGGDGKPGRLEGALSFRLDRRGAAKTVGQYNLEFGDQADSYEPQLKLRMGEKATNFQAQVAKFLGGYLDRERELTFGVLEDANGKHHDASRSVEAAICLPGVPQQETSHDCGFFIMEMILRTLQLSSKALRELATASSVEIAMLPWPSQQQILRRKAMLRDAVETLFAAARRLGTGDVEVLFKAEPDLRQQLRSALTDGGPSFTHGFDRWAAGDWDLSPSPSRSRSRANRHRTKGDANKNASKARTSSSDTGRKRKRKARRSSSSGSRPRRRRRRRSRDRSSTRSRSSSRSAESKPAEKLPAAQLPSFTKQDLELLPTGALRTLCVQRGVLPAGIVERTDLLVALAPMAVPPKAAPVTKASVVPPARKAFTRGDLDGMATKELRMLCIQKGVLPPPPLERQDLVQALRPFAEPG